MRVLITGATGLIGTELTQLFLSKGIEVHYLTTRKNGISNKPDYTGFYWNPEKGYIDESALIGVDAIVHLAGATIARRWTDGYRQEIIESRIFTANLLYNTLKKNPNQVKQIVSASAIGVYPDSYSEVYTENSTQTDEGFLGCVVEKWEASIDKFKLLDIKVAKIRTGLVLSEKGGALPQMAKPIKLGFGAAFGSGRQFQSWIHLEDIAAVYYFSVINGLDGVYNAVSLKPVTNRQLTRAIASALHKPLFLPNIPRFAMKLALGDMHELLYSSQNVSSVKLRNAGFELKYPTIEKVLDDIYK